MTNNDTEDMQILEEKEFSPEKWGQCVEAMMRLVPVEVDGVMYGAVTLYGQENKPILTCMFTPESLMLTFEKYLTFVKNLEQNMPIKNKDIQ